jgi:acylpyruvate hydrolase
MYIVSYRTHGPWRAGIAHGPLVADVASLNRVPHEAGQTVRALIEEGPGKIVATLELAERAFETGNEYLVPLKEVDLGPPVPDPDKILCLGLNYFGHATELKMDVPTVPTLFAKFRNSLVGPYSPIVLPRVSKQIDYEGELAFVIGRRCKDVVQKEALSCVAGYTIMNDVSARDLQFQSSQWTAGKSLDSFAPMGPGIMPAAFLPDPQNLSVVTRVNGVTFQSGNTADMIFSVSQTISFVSSIMTLEPGDIISTGTPAGVGFTRTPQVFLRDGDIVEVEIKGIGAIRNPVVGG